jgi:putative transposase
VAYQSALLAQPSGLEWATLDWVDGFNHKRLLGPIGNIPPAEAEAAYCRQQAALPKAA